MLVVDPLGTGYSESPDDADYSHLLLGQGKHGVSMKPEEIELLRRGLPDPTIEMVVDAGLYIHEEKREAVVRALVSMATVSEADDGKNTTARPSVGSRVHVR